MEMTFQSRVFLVVGKVPPFPVPDKKARKVSHDDTVELDGKTVELHPRKRKRLETESIVLKRVQEEPGQTTLELCYGEGPTFTRNMVRVALEGLVEKGQVARTRLPPNLVDIVYVPIL